MSPSWKLRRLAFVAALGFAATLAGCGHSPDTQLFVLTVQPSRAPTAYAGSPLQVRTVHLPPQFDRPEVLSVAEGGQVRPHPFAQWAAPVGELAQSALTADLAARLPEGKVVFPNAPASAGTLLVTVDVLEAQISGGGGAADVSWTLTTRGPKPSDPIQAVTHTAQLHVDPEGSGPAGDADALARLLSQLADKIAASL